MYKSHKENSCMLIQDSHSMSSDLYEFDGCFFSDPFSPFSDSSSIDILQAFPENNYNYNPLMSSSSTLTHENNLDTPVDEIDQIATTTTTNLLHSSSPPSHQLESLSLYQMSSSLNSSNGVLDFCPLEVKTEESQISLYDYYSNNNNENCNSSFLPHSYGGSDNAVKMMQRSYSSNSFEGKLNNTTTKGVLFQPRFDSVVESPNLHSQVLTSPDHSFSSGHMRRVCSTGDLQNMKTNQTNQRLCSSPLATENSFIEEANIKVGRYSAEERKERILRYRAKRTHRNFNKTIKYACRKTLADNRPRIRGRFARNDEPGEIPKAATFQRYEDEDELWIDGFQEEYDEGIVARGALFSNYAPTTQFQQFSYIHN